MIEKRTVLSRVVAILVFGIPAVQAADLNGYTAEYECRAGGPQCDVDVTALVAAPCDEIIEPGAPWSSINWANDVICLRVGDHSAKGELFIGSSGTVGARKVLRCVDVDGSECDDAWQVPASSRATVRKIDMGSHDFWIIGGITFDIGLVDLGIGLKMHNAANNIVNRVYAFDGGDGSWGMIDFAGGTDNTVQNSVLGPCEPWDGESERYAIGVSGMEINLHIVNNEMFDCNKVFFALELDGVAVPGLLIENNDIYWPPGFNGSEGEHLVNLKAAATSGNPGMIIHNRMWGGRPGGGEGSCLATSVGGPGTNQPYSGADWLLVKDNICFDTQYGFITTGYDTSVRVDNHSYVGNILFGITTHNTGFATIGLQWWRKAWSEAYFNTFVGVRRSTGSGGWLDESEHQNSDIRCNVIIDSDRNFDEGGDQTGSQIDFNVYYETVSSGEVNRTEFGIATRTNSTSYSAGDIVRRSSDRSACSGPNDPDCFLYAARNGGVTGSSEPSYATELGGEFQDGAVLWKAIRGPYTFWRKLRTNPEQYVIPYAGVHNSAPEHGFCPSDTGSRVGIGVSDDTLGNGMLMADRTEVARSGTPGALEARDGTSAPPLPPPSRSPFGGAPALVPGVIEAENFDYGGEGVAYHDTTTANEGGAVPAGRHADEAVDIEVTMDAGGGHDVGWVTPGEWLEYTVDVQPAGTYDIEIRYAASGPGGTMHVEFNGTNVTGSITLLDSGGWQTWSSVTMPAVSLSGGEQIMRLAFDTGSPEGWLANINYVRFTQSGSNPIGMPYPGPDAAVIPGIVEAEHFDNGGEGVAYHDSTPGQDPGAGAYRTDEDVEIEVTADSQGAYDVGWVTPGEWLAYSVNVATAGVYNIEVRHANLGPGGTMHVEFDGIDKTGSIALPDTGGWQTWQTTVVTGVPLSAGQQLMRLMFDTGSNGWLANINYVEFVQQ